jgi:DNA-binding Xre family transcriptional regulator
MTDQKTKEILEMAGTIRVKVPELLSNRKLRASDLMYGARLAPATAYRLASGDADAITFDVLGNICDFFGVGVGDVL